MTRSPIDYSLTGASTERARRDGLVNAEWFLADIDPDRLRELQERGDVRAALDVALWGAALLFAAYVAWWSLGVDGVIWSQAIPAFVVYGALYGGAADPRWHECGHGTAFRSRRANDIVYVIASFMLFRGPTVWRWSHYRHHTDTIVVGRDAEIAFQRPPDRVRTLFFFTGIPGGFANLWRLVRHAAGRLDPDAADLVPESEHRRVVWESRAFVAIVAAVVVWCVVARSPVPVLFVGGPTIYGMWLMVFFGITQHAGLREDVLDHRYNTRTVYMNPVFRFLYLNMNYHVEHHMFPSVPYPALPRLHAEIADQLAPPLPNTFAAYRQIWSTLARQRREPAYEIPLAVPDVPVVRHRIDVGESHWVRHPDGAVDLAAADSLDPGEVRRVDIDGRTFVLACLGADDFALCDGICTHARVHLAGGALVDGQIECPKHNARFDVRTGEPTRGPATTAVGAYRVEATGGRVVTRLEPQVS